MAVRGAPAIGVCAAFGLALAAGVSASQQSIHAAAAMLRETRPTAVNLQWAIERMMKLATTTPESELHAVLIREAQKIFDEDLEANRRIGAFGNALLSASSTVLTHCNAGALATTGYGTALGVIRAANEAGKKISVFADETRPFLQGSRLTAWELSQDGIDVTVITDNMAAHFFQLSTFDAVIVGADRIAANGDTANKIGTYGLAVLAHAHDVPFYVAAPLSTIDPRCPSGNEIPIEERSLREVAEMSGVDGEGVYRTVRTAPEGVGLRHPAFDVTPARLITAIITDRGVMRPPYPQSLKELISSQPEYFGNTP